MAVLSCISAQRCWGLIRRWRTSPSYRPLFLIRPASTNGFHFIKGSFYRVVNRGYKHQIRICEPVKEPVCRNHPSFCIIQFGGRHPPNWFNEFGTQRVPNLALRNNVLCNRLFQLRAVRERFTACAACACNVLCIVLICFTNASKSMVAKVRLLWL